MPKLSTQLALLAFAGTLAVIPPVFAAPMGTGAGHPAVDCTVAANANDPFCVAQAGGNHPHNGNSNANNTSGTNNGGSTTGGTTGSSSNNMSAGQNATQNNSGFNFNQHDRDQFHRQFHGFNFGVFAAPNFSINLGVRVPHAYNLRPVPRNIYRQYPQFRGDLYFVTRQGSVVIVSSHSYKILAVI